MRNNEKRDLINDNLKCSSLLTESKGGLYCCPLCGSGTGENRSGALKVYANDNKWHCFACGEGGDAIDLLSVFYGLDYKGALDKGGEILGTIDQGEEPKKPQQMEPAKKEYKDIRAYCERCREYLGDEKAISYLSARGISETTARAAGVGYDAAADTAGSGHPAPRLIFQCGNYHYVARRIDGKSEFAKMNNRNAKMGIFNAAALYSGAAAVFIVEGVFDALSILEIGHQAIATNGAGQLRALIEMLKEKPTDAALIICKDNDQAEATRENIKKHAENLKAELRALGIKYIEADIVGSSKDANEALVNDKAAFIKKVEAAEKMAAEHTADQEEAARQTDIDIFLTAIQEETYKPAATGLKFFDELMGGGIIPQTLTILLAAPAAGKTTLCQQIGEALARTGRGVDYINLEMSKEQMLAKSISARLFQRGRHITAIEVLQAYKREKADLEAINAVAREYEATTYKYLRYHGANEIGSGLNSIIKHLETEAQAFEARGEKAPAVIIDYLHLIQSERGAEAQEHIKNIVTSLKAHAVKHNTFIIAISATNRSANGGKIRLDQARDSSNIEYTGDYAITLNYEQIDNGSKTDADIDELQQEKPRKMILRVVKGRFIETGKSVKVDYDAAHNIFYGRDQMRSASDKEAEEAQSIFAPLPSVRR